MQNRFLFSIICVAICFAFLCPRIENASAIGVGDTAPNFALTDAISGKTVSLADFQGKTILLDFFATWCGPCREAIDNDLVPLWNEYYADDPNVVFLSIDIWEPEATPQTLQNFASAHGMTWPILMGTNSGIENDYTVEAVPTVFIIDGAANMKIKNYHLGSPGYTVILTEINAVIPEFLPSFFLSTFIIAASLAAVVYKKKNHSKEAETEAKSARVSGED